MKRMLGMFLGLLAFDSGAQELRDPTRPPAVSGGLQSPSVEERRGPKLQSIIRRSEHWIAVINGDLVRQGQFWQQFAVKEISAQQVVLDSGKEQMILRLAPTVSIKKEWQNEF